jgi:hypothetical protein
MALTRIKDFLSHRIDQFSITLSQLGLTRKDNADTAQHITFMSAMSDAMRHVFGRPLDDAVCQLTNIIFPQNEVTIDDVKNAQRNAATRRRKQREAGGESRDKLIELMRSCEVPITRDNYLAAMVLANPAYGDEPPTQLSAEVEARLPPEVRKGEP